MILERAYYRVLHPFHYFHVLGSKPTNSWIGRSQVLATIVEADNAKVGSEFHAYPAGLYLEVDNRLMKVRMNLPPDVFLKDNGDIPENRRVDEMLAQGLIEKLETPRFEWRSAISEGQEKFPFDQKEVIYKNHSLEYQSIWNTYMELASYSKDMGHKIYLSDMGVLRTVAFQVNDDKDNLLFKVECGDDLDNYRLSFAPDFAKAEGIISHLQTVFTDAIERAYEGSDRHFVRFKTPSIKQTDTSYALQQIIGESLGAYDDNVLQARRSLGG